MTEKEKLNNKALYIYNIIVEQSRKPFFFNNLKIKNDFYGNFEIVSINMTFVLWSLKRYQKLAPISQNIIDIFFRDLDGCLRELGVSDLSVGRKIKIIAENYYGRLSAYTESFEMYLKNRKINFLVKKIEKNIPSLIIKNLDELTVKEFEKYLIRNIKYFETVDSLRLENSSFRFY